MCESPFPVTFPVSFPIGNFLENLCMDGGGSVPNGPRGFPLEVPQFPAGAGYRGDDG